MTWTCAACQFEQNQDDDPICAACKTESHDQGGGVAPAAEPAEVVVIELPPKEKLGVKLMPPKEGIIDHGLSIDNIDNPLLEGKVQAGDLIVAIGGQNVDGMGFSDAIDLIRKLPRPLAISFEIDDARREEVQREKRQQDGREEWDTQLTTYHVVFDEGPMGLNLEEATRYGIDGAVVRALKGQAKSSGMITVGDIVYKVNDVDVLCMPYNEVMQVIRTTPAPRTLQFVPKDKLADVQRVNSRHSESFRIRESTVKGKLLQSPRIAKDEVNDGAEDGKSIERLILDNQAATIKKGRMYKQGRVMRNWKSRYFVLSVSKLEYFKNPSATTSRGELSFLDYRCTVRSMPGTSDVVCRQPNVTAQFLLELRVGDRRLVMACTSENDKKAWMDALKLGIDASKTLSRKHAGEDVSKDMEALRVQRSASISAEGTADFLGKGGRLSQFNYASFSVPVVHVAVVSATNLAKPGSTVNAVCEVTVGSETFKTSVVKSQRSPIWKQDNSASFEAPTEEMVIEIRVYDEHVFRSTELIATLPIPLKSLPNMDKTTKKYPLAVGNRSSGAVLTLTLEYVNKAKAFKHEQARLRLGDDLGNSTVMNERDEMVKIQTEAQLAADEASLNAARAEEEARTLLEQAQKKAEAAMAAAREEQEQGKAAVEAAMAEATRAKEEAEKQAEEARRAQEEAQKLIEANRHIQQQSSEARELQGPSVFLTYRKMIENGETQDSVRTKMVEDGVDEVSIAAFFDGINSYDEKVRSLQAEVEKLKRMRSQGPKQEAGPDYSNLDTDQVRLLRRLLKLEKQLQQAGIAVAADIPYEEAKAKVEEIARRMQEIGSGDVVHTDKQIQKQLREEYFRLEQDMEKYNTALMLTDEYAAEQARKEREWEEENHDANVKAVKAIRRMMPVDVKRRSEAELQTMTSPSGKVLPRELARKFKRTNALELLRMSPQDISRSHPSLLQNFRVVGLTVTERRALHMHLRDIAQTWQDQQGDDMSKKKYEWFKTMKETFKNVVNSYNNHVKQYGPADNHPYETRDCPGIGCPLIGKQCPIKADQMPAYNQDLGYPEGDVFLESTVQKGGVENSGAQSLKEAQDLARKKKSNEARNDILKAHYKNVRLAAEANGACEHIDTVLDQLESRQLLWFQARLKNRLSKTESAQTIKVELHEFGELVNELRLATLKFAERSGMNLTGKRNPDKDTPDTRSTIECKLAIMMCDGTTDAFDGMSERMEEVRATDKRLRAALPALRELLKELRNRSETRLESFADKGPPPNRTLKLRAEILKEAKEKNAKEASGGGDEVEEEGGGGGGNGGGGDRPPHPLMGRGRGRGGRGNDLMSAIAARGRGRGKGDSDGPPVDMMAAIRGRGRGRGRGGGVDFLSAIKARGQGKGDDDSGEGGGGGDLMSAIRGRGRGGGRGGQGDFLSAIAARRKD